MKHDTRTEPSEKAKHPEEEESSGDEGGKAVASGSEEAQAEGKKKKRSGFRDRKVRNLVMLHLQLLHCSERREKTCTASYSCLVPHVLSLACGLYLSLFSVGPWYFGNLLSWHDTLSFFGSKPAFLGNTAHTSSEMGPPAVEMPTSLSMSPSTCRCS